MTESLKSYVEVLAQACVNRGLTIEDITTQLRTDILVGTLTAEKGNLIRSAKRLGMHRNTLHRQITELSINIHAIRHSCRKNRRNRWAEQERAKRNQIVKLAPASEGIEDEVTTDEATA